MRVETLIRHRTQDKEIRLSGDLVMTKDEWEQRGGTYHGSLGNAAKEGWYTVRNCERMGLPVTETEFQSCEDFAMYKDCYAENYIVVDRKQKVPCLPVFFRDKEKIWVRLCRKLPNGLWSEPCDSTSLSIAEYLVKTAPQQYKIAGYLKQK